MYLKTDRRMQSGFTLIELLVVISIISLLIAILLPALSKARDSAQNSSCLSNTKQICTAMISYAADNFNTLPSFSSTPNPWSNDKSFWWYKLEKQDYCSNAVLTGCPEAVSTNSSYGDHGYGINFALTGAKHTVFVKMDDVIQPSVIFLSGDSQTGANGGHYPVTHRGFDGIRPWDGEYYVPYFRHGANKNDLKSNTEAPAWGSKYDDLSGTANFSFIDGHAQSMAPINAMVMDAPQSGREYFVHFGWPDSNGDRYYR